jgi:hypothetical protein
MSLDLEASTSWGSKGLSWPVQELPYRLVAIIIISGVTSVGITVVPLPVTAACITQAHIVIWREKLLKVSEHNTSFIVEGIFAKHDQKYITFQRERSFGVH